METLIPVDRHRIAQSTASMDEVAADLATRDVTPRNEQQWCDALTFVQHETKALEDERTELTKPLLAAKREVDAAFAPAKEAGERLLMLIKTKLGEYRARLAAERQQAVTQAAAAAAAGDYAAASALVEASQGQDTSGTATVWGWDFVVVDEALVPAQYKIVDPAKVKAYAKAYAKSETIPEVPGLVFRRVASVRSTGRRK